MRRFTRWFAPLLVAAVSIGITGWLWNHERENQALSLRNGFDFGLRQTATRVESRITSYGQMLRGVAGLFRASAEVSRQDFGSYSDMLAAGPDFAGLRTLAYAAYSAAPQGVGGHSRQRAEATARLIYAAPFAGPITGAIGADLLREPVRRAAMLQARDSGSMSVTQRLRTDPGEKVDEDWGILLFMPVYARDRPHDTIQSRRENLVGWVLASFRIGDLMSSLYGEDAPGLEVIIHDGVDLDPATRLYPPTGAVGDRHRPARFEAQEYIAIAGHTWTLSVRSTADFEQRFSNDSARIIAIAGTGLGIVLAVLTWQLLTGRERSHTQAREMTRQLRESSERYRRIVDTADEGIWMFDVEARTSFANPKMHRLLGHREGELMGRCWNDFLAESERVPLADALDAPRCQQFALRLLRSDGSAMWASVSTSPILDDDGSHVGALAMVTDVTRERVAEIDRAHLEAQLRQSQKMEAIGTLAGGVAHDFNNILASILGNLHLVRQDFGADHPSAALLDQIRLAAERGRSLVQQIVAFSRREPQERVPQPLRPLLEEAAGLLRSTLPTMVELELRLSDVPLRISADATQLQQVLINLCTNAWHAMPEGKGRIVIALDAVRLDARAATRLGRLSPGQHAHVRVSDDGCGMDELTLQRIFEPFYTTKAVGKGTGLGLSVVHGIVASHGAAITVDSVPGRGSSFDMYFPLLGVGGAVAAQAPALPVEVRGDGRHVLYVDDDPVMALMIEQLLQRAGYRVTCLTDSRVALERAADRRDDPVAVVVTDFNMPDLSGVDLARELASRRPGLPVVITSGNITDKLRTEAAALGIQHLLQKEFALERLAALVQQVLRESDEAAATARPVCAPNGAG